MVPPWASTIRLASASPSPTPPVPRALLRSVRKKGMKMRGKKVREIKSAAVEHVVNECGAAFAAVVLWD